MISYGRKLGHKLCYNKIKTKIFLMLPSLKINKYFNNILFFRSYTRFTNINVSVIFTRNM